MDHTCTSAASIVCFILLYLSYRTSGLRVPEIVDKRGDPRRSLSILVLIDVPATGHIAAPVALSAKLARRGHNVTLCSTSVEGRADVADDVAENVAKKAGINFLNTGKTSEAFSLYFDDAFRTGVLYNAMWIHREVAALRDGKRKLLQPF